MGKKIGQTILVRSGASYDRQTNTCDDPNSRSRRTATITKVMPHGVKTKEFGYVNNKRIICVYD